MFASLPTLLSRREVGSPRVFRGLFSGVPQKRTLSVCFKRGKFPAVDSYSENALSMLSSTGPTCHPASPRVGRWEKREETVIPCPTSGPQKGGWCCVHCILENEPRGAWEAWLVNYHSFTAVITSFLSSAGAKLCSEE